MTRFLHRASFLPGDSRSCFRLLAYLLLGSLLGALAARTQASAVPGSDFDVAQSSWVSFFLCAALFPCLMAASFLLDRRLLLFSVFFLKGALVSFTLGLFARAGLDRLAVILPAVALQSLLPLAVQFYVGAVWLRGAERSDGALVLLLPMLALAVLSALLRICLTF